MEACVHYKNKDMEAASAALREAYENASPNDILMPFLELGKDMRTLTAAGLDCGAPQDWLDAVNRKSSLYAKHQALFVSDYKKANNINGETALSARESEVLRDLYRGLSRSEIAENQQLSVNTVKMVINIIYEKLNAANIADVIRIAAERKLV